VANAARWSVHGEELSFVVIEGVLLVYLFFALRRVYRDGVLAAGARSLVLALAFGKILQRYRFLLFFVTLWATRES
jgi:hypothetical protein